MKLLIIQSVLCLMLVSGLAGAFAGVESELGHAAIGATMIMALMYAGRLILRLNKIT